MSPSEAVWAGSPSFFHQKQRLSAAPYEFSNSHKIFYLDSHYLCSQGLIEEALLTQANDIEEAELYMLQATAQRIKARGAKALPARD